MAKFAITTKTGRSVTIDAPNFQKAEQEAKRRFGTGCVVDLVGNACGKCQSDNDIVKNALAYAAARNANVEVKSKRSGVKIIVSLDKVRNGTEWGKDLTGYERNMLGRGINEMETDDYRYKIVNAVVYHNYKVGDYVGMLGVFPAADVKMKIIKVNGDKITVDGGQIFDAKELHYWNYCRNAVANAAPLSAHEASVLLSGKRKAVTQYEKVEPNTLYYRALGGIFAVPESDTMKAAIEAIGSRVLPYQVGGVVGNAVACNDKWIDQFHVIITKDKPDANLLQALKEKAAASKILHRNYSNKEARDAHNKAEDKAYEIAKRLGAKWIEQGAVLKVVMPGNDPYSFNAEK